MISLNYHFYSLVENVYIQMIYTHTRFIILYQTFVSVCTKARRKERDVLFVCGILELVFHSPKLFSKL